MKDADKVKRVRGGAAANTEPPQPTRRQVLKGLTTGTVAIGALSPSAGGAVMPPLKTRGATKTTTVCPFCGVGCGQVVSTRNGHVINSEGDAGHPISEGTLCSMGLRLSRWSTPRGACRKCSIALRAARRGRRRPGMGVCAGRAGTAAA